MQYKVQVRPNGKGNSIVVRIEAKTDPDARRLAEAQYGKGNVLGVARA